MPTIYKYRVNIVAPEASKAALNALWTALAEEGDNEATTFGVPLSADGKEPATHRGVSTAATEEMGILIQHIFTAELAGCTIDVMPYTENNWTEFLAANGMKVIQPKEI